MTREDWTSDYISREAAKEEFYKVTGWRCAIAVMDSIPAADVRPVVRAVWRRYSPFTDTYECSNCGEQVIDQQFRTSYCPNCGAKMEES